MRQSQNRVITGIIWNIINSNIKSKLTNLTDEMLLIPIVKLADLAMFLLSWIKLSSYSNAFGWPIPSIDWVDVPESMNNLLNLVSLYYESIHEL